MIDPICKFIFIYSRQYIIQQGLIQRWLDNKFTVYFFFSQLLLRQSQAESLSFTDHDVFFFPHSPGTQEILSLSSFPLDEDTKNLNWAFTMFTSPAVAYVSTVA